MSDKIKTHVWPVLTYADAPAAIDFLIEAFGFEKSTVITREDDPSIVSHAELRWPSGGGIMLSSYLKDDTEFGTRPPGEDALYVVTDDPDGLFERATAAGAKVMRGVEDEDYGNRGFTVYDPEGKRWSFGTYAGGG